MFCFCPDVRCEDDLLRLLKQGSWDKQIFDYLSDVMSDKTLEYDPTELFEMQARLADKNKFLNLQFWDVRNSGVCKNRKYTMNKKQRELFNLFVEKIREIYQLVSTRSFSHI